ncbi:hypothetical protein CBL_01855 [Carabus blaptoides fortunei]
MQYTDELKLEYPSLIIQYEEIFKTLNEQVDFYKVEHKVLKQKIIKLVNENNSLSKNLEEILHSKITSFDQKNNQLNIDVVKNLKKQLEIVSQEKDTTFDLWQNSLKTVDHLDIELKVYQRSGHGYISTLELEKEKQKHTLELQELQNKMTMTIKDLNENNKNLLENLSQRTDELSQALDGQRTVLLQIQEKDTEITEMKDRLNNMVYSCNQLQEQLKSKEELINNLFLKDQESKAKVLESIILVEAAIVEKCGAYDRELKAKDEVTELSNSLAQLIKEADEKIKNEVEVIKKQYNENLRRLLDDINELKMESNSKNLELQKVTRGCKILEEEISRRNQGSVLMDDSNTSKLLVLEKNLESSFQKLLLSERRNMQITAERDTIKMDMEQVTKSFERDMKNIEVEKQNLERKIKTLQNELFISTGFVEDYVVQIKELNARMTEMETEMKSKLEQKDKKYDQILADKINRLIEKNETVQKEMQIHLESEHDLNKRWQSETKEITTKFHTRIKELKIENAQLRRVINNYQQDTKRSQTSYT